MLTLLPPPKKKMIVMVHMRMKTSRSYQEIPKTSRTINYYIATKIINGCFLIPSKNKQILDSILSKINLTF